MYLLRTDLILKRCSSVDGSCFKYVVHVGRNLAGQRWIGDITHLVLVKHVVGLGEVSFTCRAIGDHLAALLDNGDGESHTGHIVAAHLAGHLVFARSRRLEGVVDAVDCSGIDQVDTDEHAVVLRVLVERRSIGFIGDEGKGVIVIAAIGDDEVIRDANTKDFHRGDNLVVDE